MKKISIITVTYNSSKYLKDCIESVISQDYKNIEYIIIDGNSSDNTLEIIKSYESNVHTYISEKDSGLYDAINKGIKLSTGDYVGLLHSDDFFKDNNVVSRIINSFSNVDTDSVYANSFYINQTSNKVTRKYSSQNFKKWKFRFGLMPSHPTFYIKGSKLKSHDLYDEKFKIAADFDLLLRHFCFYNTNSKFINDDWVIMREGGISTKGISSKIKITKELMLSCKKNKVYTNYFFLTMRFLFKIKIFFK